MESNEFGKLSIELTKSLALEEKKNNGIYFTPRSIIARIFERVSLEGVRTILEPSCGSMEFIRFLEENTQGKVITAIEKNDAIYEKIARETFTKNRVVLIHTNFLDLDVPIFGKFDLIVGNPPYYVMKARDVPERWVPFVQGRPNVFTLFILRAVEMLTEGGILAFVLPKSFLNSAYYERVRKLIAVKMTIVDIFDNSEENFMGTAQETCSIIVKNSFGKNSKWVFESGAGVIFSQHAQQLKELSRGATTLRELGCLVYIGKVVWNGVKDTLSTDEKNTLLIYSSDISSTNELVVKQYSNPAKKNYICKLGNTRPMIVVNRGYGTGKYDFRWAFIDLRGRPFLVENHLVCIESEDSAVYSQILKSFRDERTTDFIAGYFGNGAISATELECVLPIYST